MNNVLPGYLVPSVLIEAVIVVIAVLAVFRNSLRLAAGLLIPWFFAALALSLSGFFEGQASGIPTIQYGLLLPIFIGIALFWRWPAFRRVVESVPQRGIVTVQVYRVVGLIFLVLYAAGRLPGAFAWPAGIGDITVGLLAPLAGLAYARRSPGSARWLMAWNLLGIGDLVVAVTTGFLTSSSPLQLLAFDKPNELIGAFPLVMIPVFLVPLSILLHLASLQKLSRTEAIQGPSMDVRDTIRVGCSQKYSPRSS